MEQSTVKAAILSAISMELDVWLSKQGAIKDGYEYEKHYIEFTQKVSRTILLTSLGKQPGSRNKKNFTPVLGRSI